MIELTKNVKYNVAYEKVKRLYFLDNEEYLCYNISMNNKDGD